MRINPWSLLRSGERNQAIEQLQKEFRTKPDASHAMELGVAYLWLKDYDAAWHHFHQVRQTHARSHARFYGMAGVAKWCLGEQTEAIGEWRAGLKSQYADGAGGVTLPLLLFVATIVNSDLFERSEAERLLTLRAEDPRVRNWPGPIAEFVLGRIDEESLQNRCMVRDESDSLLRLWLMEFYVGVLALDRGDQAKFQAMIRRTGTAVDDDFDSLKKHFLAKLWHEEFFIARHAAVQI